MITGFLALLFFATIAATLNYLFGALWAAIGTVVAIGMVIGFCCLFVASREPHYDEWPDADDLGLALLAPDDPRLPEEGN